MGIILLGTCHNTSSFVCILPTSSQVEADSYASVGPLSLVGSMTMPRRPSGGVPASALSRFSVSALTQPAHAGRRFSAPTHTSMQDRAASAKFSLGQAMRDEVSNFAAEACTAHY